MTHSIEEALYLGDRVLIMTARPGRIKAEIRVPQARPRYVAGYEFTRLRKQAMDVLSEEITRSMEQESTAAVTS